MISSVYISPVQASLESCVTSSIKFPKNLNELQIIPKPFADTTAEVLLARNSEGKRFIIKHDKSNDFVINEFYANRAFKALGLPVAEARLFPATSLQTTKGTLTGTFLILEYLEDTIDLRASLTGDATQDRPLMDKLSKDFIKICLMGAWDVVGLCYNNILVQKGQPYYIDQGLAFGYMHNGALKRDQKYLAGQYSPLFDLKNPSDWWETSISVPEIVALRNPHDRLGAALFYENLTSKEIQEQINQLDLTPLRELSKVGLFPFETLEILERRAEWLKSVNLASFEAEWNKFTAERAQALSETLPGHVPLFVTRGMELLAAIRGGCFSQISESEDPSERPLKVGIIYREVTKDFVWLQLDKETGTYVLPTWKAENPNNNFIWEVTGGSGWRTGTRTRISNDFVSSPFNGTRYYVVDRMGGIPKENIHRFTNQEALERLQGQDRILFKAYLNTTESVQQKESSEITNISPTAFTLKKKS